MNRSANELYREIDRAVKKKDPARLYRIGKKIREYGSERSWLFGYYSDAWHQLSPYGGYNQASEVLGITPKVCANSANIIRRFFLIRSKDLLFSHYAYLYYYGVPKDDWEELIEMAIQENASVMDFQRFIKDTYLKKRGGT